MLFFISLIVFVSSFAKGEVLQCPISTTFISEGFVSYIPRDLILGDYETDFVPYVFEEERSRQDALFYIDIFQFDVKCFNKTEGVSCNQCKPFGSELCDGDETKNLYGKAYDVDSNSNCYCEVGTFGDITVVTIKNENDICDVLENNLDGMLNKTDELCFFPCRNRYTTETPPFSKDYIVEYVPDEEISCSERDGYYKHLCFINEPNSTYYNDNFDEIEEFTQSFFELTENDFGIQIDRVRGKVKIEIEIPSFYDLKIYMAYKDEVFQHRILKQTHMREYVARNQTIKVLDQEGNNVTDYRIVYGFEDVLVNATTKVEFTVPNRYYLHKTNFTWGVNTSYDWALGEVELLDNQLIEWFPDQNHLNQFTNVVDDIESQNFEIAVYTSTLVLYSLFVTLIFVLIRFRYFKNVENENNGYESFSKSVLKLPDELRQYMFWVGCLVVRISVGIGIIIYAGNMILNWMLFSWGIVHLISNVLFLRRTTSISWWWMGYMKYYRFLLPLVLIICTSVGMISQSTMKDVHVVAGTVMIGDICVSLFFRYIH